MWWLLAVPAALLADALLDPDKRAKISETWRHAIRGPVARLHSPEIVDALLELEAKVVHRASRSVDPATVRPPKSPTAVKRPRRLTDPEPAPPTGMVWVGRNDPMWHEAISVADGPPDHKGRLLVPSAWLDHERALGNDRRPRPNRTRPRVVPG